MKLFSEMQIKVNMSIIDSVRLEVICIHSRQWNKTPVYER